MRLSDIKSNMKRIDHIYKLYANNTGIPVVIGFEDFIALKKPSMNFFDYIAEVHQKNEFSPIFIDDDIGLGSSLYLPTEPIWYCVGESAILFWECSDDKQWLAMYIELLEQLLKDEFELPKSAALQDLIQNYKVLPLEELVERYKDQKWFTGNKK